MKKKYRHLSFEERFAIEVMYWKGTEIRSIAEFLGRSPNKKEQRDTKSIVLHGEYDAKKAKQKSLAERWRAKEISLKVAMSGFLYVFCRRKTGKEVVSKTNQWIFKKRIWNRLL